MHQTTNVIDSVHNLENADMNREQAEALTKLVRDSVAEGVQHLATKAEVAAQLMAIKAELADLRVHVDAQLLATKAEVAAQLMAIKAELIDLRQHMATKAELAELREQVLELREQVLEVREQVSEIKAGLVELKASHEAQVAHSDAQIALLRGEITEKLGANLKYMALSIGFSTVAIIAALFAVPTVG